MAPRSGVPGLGPTPARLARVAGLACAAILLAFGLVALAQFGGEAGLGASEAAAAGDGPITASGEVSRIVFDATRATTAFFLRGADHLEFRMAGDVSVSYAPGDFVRVDGNKTGSVIEGRAIRHATSPWAAAAPALAAGGALAAILVADQLVPRLSGRGTALAALLRKVRPPKLSGRQKVDDALAPELE